MYTHGTILHTEASCLCVCGPVSYLITQTRVSWKYRRVLQAGRMRLTLPQEALRMCTHVRSTILHYWQCTPIKHYDLSLNVS